MMKRMISLLLVLVMVLAMIPMTVFAEEGEAAEVTEVTQETEPAEETEPAVAEVTVTAEETQAAEPVCTCGTDDVAVHATSCPLYVLPAEPQCFCAEKCTEVNEWCDICGFDYTACTGEDSSIAYEEVPCTHVDEDETKGYCDLCVELLVTAEGTSADGLHWVYYEGNGELIITGEGPMQNYGSNNVPWEDFDTKIKSLVIGEGVTTIGDYAFHQGWNLTSVSMPSTITSIGKCAFDESKILTNINLPENLVTIGEEAFHDCHALTSIELPDSVTTLGVHAFAYCKALTDVTLSASLTAIPDTAFRNCTSLQSIQIPGSVKTIGERAFSDCSALGSVTFNEGLESIGLYAFTNCISLAEISIPTSMKSIGEHAFDSCTGLTDVTLPEGLETIETYAFENCSSLSSITLPQSLIEIGSSAFRGTGLTSVMIPDGVKLIEQSAFRGCTSLERLEIPGGVSNITRSAFEGCTALKSVIILDTLTKIGDSVFKNCSALTSVVLPGTLTDVTGNAFDGTNLTTAHYLGSEEQLSKVDFNSDKVLSSKIHACIMAEGKTATCTEPGYSAGWKCSKANCDFTMGTTVTEPLGHDYDNGICENCGEACAHTGGVATCTHRAKCEVCGESYGERNPNNHAKDTFYYKKKNADFHEVKHSCCETVYATEAHIYENKECTFCGADEPSRIVITQQPESVQQEIGKKFAITVKAEGEGLTYQWYVKESGAKAFKLSVNKTASYAYTMQTYMHKRQVYCVVTDINGNFVQTETATITRPPMELKLLAQPEDVCVEIGQKFSVKPTVQGDDLTYQWYYKESYMKEFAVSSNKTPAYAYTMQTYMHNRTVYCVITDKDGNSVRTEPATITRPPMELKLLTQPEDVYAEKGEKFSIKPNVQGDGLTYQWYYKESYQKKFSASSNKSSAYAYAMQSYMNGRSVYCVITDQYGNQVQTEAVTIHLK